MVDVSVNTTQTSVSIVNGTINVSLQESTAEAVILGIAGPTGPAGADGEVVTIVEQAAIMSQTTFSISASATGLRIFDINGIGYLDDVSISPPGSGNVVYTGDYILEADDIVIIGFVTT